MDALQETAVALEGEFGVEIPDLISEETILKKLKERVEHLIEQSAEEFWQLMYRLDISEKRLHGVMHEADVAEQVARLIYDRQMQKVVSRAAYRVPDNGADPDLKW